MPQPLRVSSVGVDLSGRFFRTDTVVGSPAAAAETIIATVTVLGDLATPLGVLLMGYAAYTVGTNGTAVTMRLRQTDASGTVVKSSGAITSVAANLGSQYIQGVDAGQVAAQQVYVMTMQVTAGSAISTVSGVSLVAIAI